MRKNSRLFCFLCKSVCGCPHGGGAATDRGGPDRGAPDAPARSRGPIAGPDRAGPDRAGSNAPAGILWYLFEAAISNIYIGLKKWILCFRESIQNTNYTDLFTLII